MTNWKHDFVGMPIVPAILNYSTPEWPAYAPANIPFEHDLAPQAHLRDPAKSTDDASDCSSDDDEQGALELEMDDDLDQLDGVDFLLTRF
jgi:hypothetical protein